MAEYINRELVLLWLRPDEWRTPDEIWRPESEFGAFVKLLPAADVRENVKGEWVSKGNITEQVGVWKCSACGKQVIRWSKPRDKYCSNCGADMREEDNAE